MAQKKNVKAQGKHKNMVGKAGMFYFSFNELLQLIFGIVSTKIIEELINKLKIIGKMK